MAVFNLQNLTENYLDYILTITDSCPKKLRVDIIPELRLTGIAILKLLIKANNKDVHDKERLSLQNEMIMEIKISEALAEVCLKHNYITKHQYEVLTGQSYELRESVKRWIASDEKR